MDVDEISSFASSIQTRALWNTYSPCDDRMSEVDFFFASSVCQSVSSVSSMDAYYTSFDLVVIVGTS